MKPHVSFFVFFMLLVTKTIITLNLALLCVLPILGMFHLCLSGKF